VEEVGKGGGKEKREGRGNRKEGGGREKGLTLTKR
jgi:hypothetical protein